jgi:hypothetical protein
MKLPVLLVAGSLAANAALVAVYFSRTPSPSTGSSVTAGADAGTTASSGSATKTAAPAKAADAGRPGKTWPALDTNDLKALAARLKAAGFPPSIVRAIVASQIAESFKTRREQLIPATEDRPFWKTDGSGFFGGGYDAKTFAAMRQLGREQSQVTKEVLGADYDAGNSEVSDAERRRFGNLPKDKIDLLRRLDEDYSELRNEVQTAARGIMLPEDREKLAMLEKEKRADLAQMLTPEEMEDYLMRSSQTTMRLRTPLTAFKASEDEFRAIYKIQAAFDEKYSYQNLGMGVMTQDLMRERQEAQKQVSEQLKTALGDQRYADYVRASDREYQQLNNITQRANLPESVALQAYEIRNATAKESNRIASDQQLTIDQKRAALQTLAQNTRAQISTALGTEAANTYLQVADRWLSRIERGTAVTFNDTGGISYRPVGAQRPSGSTNQTTTTTTTTTTTITPSSSTTPPK